MSADKMQIYVINIFKTKLAINLNKNKMRENILKAGPELNFIYVQLEYSKCLFKFSSNFSDNL